MISVFAASVPAIELAGQLASELYAWQQGDLHHLRPYERVQANLLAWRSLDQKELSFHTYLRWTTDLTDKLPGDPQTFVYDAYLKLSGVPRRTDFYLGRQFVYSGVGSALMDGVRLRCTAVRRVQLDLFGGSTVLTEDPEKVQSFSDFGTFGGRVSVQPTASTNVGLNWMLRRYGGSVSYNRLGLDADRVLGHIRLYGCVAYNMTNKRLAEVLARATYAQKRWYLSGEFTWREPSVPANSVFSIVDFHTYREVRVEAQRTVWRDLAVVTQLQATLFSGDHSLRTGLGVRSGNYSLVWQHKSGYGGQSDAAVGYANLRLGRRWDCYVSATASTYRVQDEQTDRSEAYSSSLGLVWRFAPGFEARAEGQLLRNAVQSKDARVYLRVTKNFSLKQRSGDKKS